MKPPSLPTSPSIYFPCLHTSKPHPHSTNDNLFFPSLSLLPIYLKALDASKAEYLIKGDYCGQLNQQEPPVQGFLVAHLSELTNGGLREGKPSYDNNSGLTSLSREGSLTPSSARLPISSNCKQVPFFAPPPTLREAPHAVAICEANHQQSETSALPTKKRGAPAVEGKRVPDSCSREENGQKKERARAGN